MSQETAKYAPEHQPRLGNAVWSLQTTLQNFTVQCRLFDALTLWLIT